MSTHDYATKLPSTANPGGTGHIQTTSKRPCLFLPVCNDLQIKKLLYINSIITIMLTLMIVFMKKCTFFKEDLVRVTFFYIFGTLLSFNFYHISAL